MAVGPYDRAPEGLLPASPPARSLIKVPGVLASGALANVRWQNGIQLEPEGCTLTLPASTDDLGLESCDWPYWWTLPDESSRGDDVSAPTDVGTGRKVICDGADNVTAEPYTIWRGYHCNAADLHAPARQAEIEARLRRQIEACTPAIVEHEFWTGQVAQLAGFATPYLQELDAADEINGGAPLGFVTALAELEQALAVCYCQGTHIIHAQPRVVGAWASRGLVTLSPDRTHLETVNTGAVVVPGSGYPGTDPDGSAGIGLGLSYVYGTGPVKVFLSPPRVAPYDSGGVMDTATNNMRNTVEVRIERDALHIFDQCCFVGAATNLCDEYCGSGS